MHVAFEENDGSCKVNLHCELQQNLQVMPDSYFCYCCLMLNDCFQMLCNYIAMAMISKPMVQQKGMNAVWSMYTILRRHPCLG